MTNPFRPTRILYAGLLVTISLAPRQAVGQKLNNPALEFSGITVKGDTLDLADLDGKVVVLDFWASWCGPCLEEMPFLIELYQELDHPSLEIVAINVDQNPQDMRVFLRDLPEKPPFPIIVDSQGAIAGQYDLEGMPTTVFLDRNGIVRYVHSGFKSKDKKEYRRQLSALLTSRDAGDSNLP